MPAYFYHISLELLPSGPPNLNDSSPASTTDPTLILRAAREALRPFRKKRSKPAKEATGTRSTTATSALSSLRNNNNNNSESGGKQQQGTATTTATTTTSSAARPCPPSSLPDSQTPSYILPYPATLPEQISTDQRLDQISIECIDMAPDPNRSGSQQQQQRQNPRKDTSNNSNNSNDQITKGIGTSACGGLATKGKYVPLDQNLPESVWGIVHLYRDGEESPTLCDGDDDPSFLKGSAIARTSRIGVPGTRTYFGSQNAIRTSSSVASAYSPSYSRSNTAGGGGGGFAGSASASGGGDAPPPEDCTTLCILAVPLYLSPTDFVRLVGDETRDEVSHFRMIRTARANRYMVLMKFRSARKAREWQKEWNGKVFNPLEVS
jgi:BRCA1-associated protein